LAVTTLVYFQSPDNKSLYLGPKVETITGYSCKEWMADAMTKFLPRIIQQQHLLLVCKASIAFFKVLGKQFKGSYDVQANMDFILTLKNGQTCPRHDAVTDLNIQGQIRITSYSKIPNIR
jgi:hypothetical protein